MSYQNWNRSSLDAIVIGVGSPNRSIGWLHLQQLLTMPGVNVRYLVEPWWLSQEQSKTKAGQAFSDACEQLNLRHRGITFHETVETLPPVGRDRPCLAVIAVRTPDAPKAFKAAIDKGVTHIYLEKPGAQSVDELRHMRDLADRSKVSVVVGYQKNVSDYVTQAHQIDQAWSRNIVHLTFEHHNPWPEEALETIFHQNPEGLLVNQCCHELALWVTKWKLQPEDIVDVVVHQEATQLMTIGDRQDYSKLAFTLKTTHGRNFSLIASRCGGTESSITLQKGLTGETQKFTLANPELIEKARKELEECPGKTWYYPLFAPDYLKLKQHFVTHILSGQLGIPLGTPSLQDAEDVLRLATNLSPALLAQSRLFTTDADNLKLEISINFPEVKPPQCDPTIEFTTQNVVCQTPTQQRIWYAENMFQPDCRLLIDLLRPPQNRLIFCVDETVWTLYQDKINTWSQFQGIQIDLIVVPSGEQGKTLENWRYILDRLWIINPLRYSEPLVAIGGGAVTDTVGFAASVWRRFTPWVRIPTTLLGMVDASVGIKVSVNYLRKNGIGAFHSPLHTFIDPLFLRTNNERQLKAAVGEMLKAGLIYDRRIYELLQKAGSTLIKEKFLGHGYGSLNVAKDAIFMTIQAMIECIGSDLYEENLSREMDFGHTFSRWLERYEDFQLMHGEAVSIDCVFSTLIAEQKGWISQQATDEVLQTYKDLGLYIHVKGLHVGVYQEAIDQIRVHRAGNLRAPLPCPIGHCRWAAEITQSELSGAWKRLQDFLLNYPEGILDPNFLHQSLTAPATYVSRDGTEVKAMDGFANSNQVVRWGILGCGKIAGDFVQVLNALPNAEIVAVASRDRTRAQQFACRHEVQKVCEDYEQLVQDEKVDIVYIATIPELHRQHAELALTAEKHVLIEKPLATTVEDARAIEKAARASGKFCMEGMWMRFFPAVEMARQLIKNGEIGTVKHVRADLGFELLADEGRNSTKWVCGAGINAGVYPMHAAIMLLGTELLNTKAMGITDSFGHSMDAEGILYADFSNQRSALVTWSHVTETPEEIDIIGTEGKIRLHSPAHCPTKLTLISKAHNRRQQCAAAEKFLEFPLPKVEGNFFYPNSEGLYYEIMAVQRCLLAGLKECPQAPLAQSVLAIKAIRQSVEQIVSLVAG